MSSRHLSPQQFGPEYRQLPLMVTHEELGNLRSTEFHVPVRDLYDRFASGDKGNRYTPYGMERQTGDPLPDVQHVHDLEGRMRESGYDERFPIHMSNTAQIGNGNHRAVAAYRSGQQLVPVSYARGRTRREEMKSQDSMTKQDRKSGKYTSPLWAPYLGGGGK